MAFLNLPEIILKHALKTLTFVESLTQPLMPELQPSIDLIGILMHKWPFYSMQIKR